jgi:hypothetical protein
LVGDGLAVVGVGLDGAEVVAGADGDVEAGAELPPELPLEVATEVAEVDTGEPEPEFGVVAVPLAEAPGDFVDVELSEASAAWSDAGCTPPAEPLPPALAPLLEGPEVAGSRELPSEGVSCE